MVNERHFCPDFSLKRSASTCRLLRSFTLCLSSSSCAPFPPFFPLFTETLTLVVVASIPTGNPISDFSEKKKTLSDSLSARLEERALRRRGRSDQRREECLQCSLYRIKDVTRKLYLFLANDQRDRSGESRNLPNVIYVRQESLIPSFLVVTPCLDGAGQSAFL